MSSFSLNPKLYQPFFRLYRFSPHMCPPTTLHETATQMKRFLLTLSLCLIAVSGQAQPTVDAFSKCLADNTNGKERKDLARWLFVAMGAHPEMRAIATISATAPQDSSMAAGQLFTKLIAEACPAQAKAAVAAVGPTAFQTGFSVLGQLAMQELMTDKDVTAGMGLLQKYIDTSKVQSALGSK